MTHIHFRDKHFVEALGHGKVPARGFTRAISNSRKEHGRHNDSGTIAEKPGYIIINLPSRVLVSQVVPCVYDILDGMEALSDMAWDKEDRRRAERARLWLEKHLPDDHLRLPIIMDNEDGPAACFVATGKAKSMYLNRHRLARGEKVYMFAGRCSMQEPNNTASPTA